jgi:hypothetical protein
VVRQGFGDRAHIPDRYFLGQQCLQHLEHRAELEQPVLALREDAGEEPAAVILPTELVRRESA